jgi:hypothetical protein
MHTTMADPDTPNLGVWITGQQALGSCERILSDFKCLGVHIDGHDFPQIARFDVPADASLIDVISAPRMLFLAIARLPCIHRFPPGVIWCRRDALAIVHDLFCTA